MITVSGSVGGGASGGGAAGSSAAAPLIDFGAAAADNDPCARIDDFNENAQPFGGCDSGTPGNVAVGVAPGSGSSAGSDYQEAMDVDDFGGNRNRGVSVLPFKHTETFLVQNSSWF